MISIFERTEEQVREVFKASGIPEAFIGITDPNELIALLKECEAKEVPWPSPDWLCSASPKLCKQVLAGWDTWDRPAPKGAVVMSSSSEQRAACGDIWFAAM